MAKTHKKSCQFETEESAYVIRSDRDNIYKVYRIETTREIELGGFKLYDAATDEETLIDAAELVLAESA